MKKIYNYQDTEKAQFPETVEVDRMIDCSSVLWGDVYTQSLSQFHESRKDLINMADKELSDISERMNNPELTTDERLSLDDRKKEVFQSACEKDSEIRGKEMEVVRMALISGLIFLVFMTVVPERSFNFKFSKKL